MQSLISLAVLLFATTAAALSTAGHRVLVVLDQVDHQHAYTRFFGDLKGEPPSPASCRAQSIAILVANRTLLFFQPEVSTSRTRRPAARACSCSIWGNETTITSSSFPQRSRVRGSFLLASDDASPHAHSFPGLGPNLTPSLLVDFVKAGGNILVAMSSTTPASTSITALLSELDVTLPAERTGTVVDHFNYDSESAAEAHDVLVLDGPTEMRSAAKDFFTMPGAVLALPRTSGHVLGQSKLLTPLLRAPPTAYSYNPKEHFAAVDPDELFAAGRQLVLASTVQSQNSARVAVLGSVEMLRDEWMDVTVARPGAAKTKSENREFAKRLSGWTFQEACVLRVNSVEHGLKGQNETNPAIYRIKTDVVSWPS